jgi:hypothetical protein
VKRETAKGRIQNTEYRIQNTEYRRQETGDKKQEIGVVAAIGDRRKGIRAKAIADRRRSLDTP